MLPSNFTAARGYMYTMMQLRSPTAHTVNSVVSFTKCYALNVNCVYHEKGLGLTYVDNNFVTNH